MDDGTMGENAYPVELEKVLQQGVLKRLPLTFLPFVNQQLHEWEYLFPNERNSVERLLVYVASLSDGDSAELFRDVVAVEEKIGVRHWHFSTSEQTIENSSELARSAYFQEWRRAVQAVFDTAEHHAQETHGAAVSSRHRLVLLEFPRTLPFDPETVWAPWQGAGTVVHVEGNPAGSGAGTLATLLLGAPPGQVRAFGGFLKATHNQTAEHADVWVIDAGRELVDSVAAQEGGGGAAPLLLSCGRLEPFRQSFSHEMNTMRKDLTDADAVFDRLRKVDVSAWCPPEVAGDAALREFVRSVYLSGNGAVIFSNSFVEWAASEAFRRARPALLAARFGVRSKPKPFTGVAVFENQDQVNPLPAVDDFEGSALDAQILASYIWMAAGRYAEYQNSTVCVCIAESVKQAYVVAPAGFGLTSGSEPLAVDELGRRLVDWFVQA
jgi:hypothetical protein